MHRNAHTRFLRAAAVSVALIAFVATTPATIAQTPSTDMCPLPPVTLPLFDATPAATIVATPAAITGAPDASDEEITQTVETIVSCANALSQADRYAVFTDRYLASRFTGPDPADQPAFERMIATGAMPEAGTATLQRVSETVRRDDGRIEVTMHISGANGSVEDRVILAWDDDSQAWLIDEIVSFDPPAVQGG